MQIVEFELPVNRDVLNLIIMDPNILSMSKEQMKISAQEN